MFFYIFNTFLSFITIKVDEIIAAWQWGTQFYNVCRFFLFFYLFTYVIFTYLFYEVLNYVYQEWEV